jgi:hypothetical protein
VLQDTLAQREDELRLLRARTDREVQSKNQSESFRLGAEDELIKLRARHATEVKARTSLEESLKLLENEVDDLRRRVKTRGAATGGLSMGVGALSPESAKMVGLCQPATTASAAMAIGGGNSYAERYDAGYGATGGGDGGYSSRARSPAAGMRSARLEGELRDLKSSSRVGAWRGCRRAGS